MMKMFLPWQVVFHVDRIGYEWELLLSTAGTWDPVQRVLHLRNYGERVIGFESTSSSKAGCWYTLSGAAHINFFTLTRQTLDIYMNEVILGKPKVKHMDFQWWFLHNDVTAALISQQLSNDEYAETSNRVPILPPAQFWQKCFFLFINFFGVSTARQDITWVGAFG